MISWILLAVVAGSVAAGDEARPALHVTLEGCRYGRVGMSEAIAVQLHARVVPERGGDVTTVDIRCEGTQASIAVKAPRTRRTASRVIDVPSDDDFLGGRLVALAAAELVRWSSMDGPDPEVARAAPRAVTATVSTPAPPRREGPGGATFAALAEWRQVGRGLDPTLGGSLRFGVPLGERLALTLDLALGTSDTNHPDGTVRLTSEAAGIAFGWSAELAQWRIDAGIGVRTGLVQLSAIATSDPGTNGRAIGGPFAAGISRISTRFALTSRVGLLGSAAVEVVAASYEGRVPFAPERTVRVSGTGFALGLGLEMR